MEGELLANLLNYMRLENYNEYIQCQSWKIRGFETVHIVVAHKIMTGGLVSPLLIGLCYILDIKIIANIDYFLIDDETAAVYCYATR